MSHSLRAAAPVLLLTPPPPPLPPTCYNAINAPKHFSDHIPGKLALVVDAASARHGPDKSIYMFIGAEMGRKKISGQ